MRRLRDIHVWLVGYDMVSLSLYHILVLARFSNILQLIILLILLQPTTVNAESYYTRPSRTHRPKFTYCRFDWQYTNLHFGLRPPKKSRWLSPSLPPFGPRYALETHPDPS
jgi:hypothetical protein